MNFELYYTPKNYFSKFCKFVKKVYITTFHNILFHNFLFYQVNNIAGSSSLLLVHLNVF